jgi:Na+/H+ antiporter NhaD/arsenite permease-like protein
MIGQKRKQKMKKIKDFFKQETVLCVALVLAVVSSFLVTPDKQYLEYIDFRTLAILFCLMSVMAGLQKIGVFRWVAELLLAKVRRESQPVLILVLLCFFFSMLITNDVALITFVPFTITVLNLMGQEQKNTLLIPIVVMQTIAANLGSMLTPIGNPQNLYLYGKAGLTVGEFLLLMLPYTLLSLLMCLIWCGMGMLNARGKDGRDDKLQICFSSRTNLKDKKGFLTVYLLLFVLALAVVAHVVSYDIGLIVTIVVILIMDRKVFGQVDYSLLLTFVGFFVFIGNMGRIPAFSLFLQNVMEGNEVVTSILASQVISNVPAALLLSGFTDHYAKLIVGTNLGGLGTLIASMASLISYKFVSKEESGIKGKYLLYFTVVNICFLVPLVLLYIII